MEVFILSPENDKKLQEVAQQFEADFAPLMERFPEALRPLSVNFHQKFDQKMAEFQKAGGTSQDGANKIIPKDCDSTQQKLEIRSRFEQYEIPIQNAQTAIIKMQAYAEAMVAASGSHDISGDLITLLRGFTSKSQVVTELLIAVNRQLSWFVCGNPFGTAIEGALNPVETAENCREKYATGVRIEWLPRLASDTRTALTNVERTLKELRAAYKKEMLECSGTPSNEVGLKLKLGELPPELIKASHEGHRNRLETLSSLINRIHHELRPELRQIRKQALIATLPTAHQSTPTQRS